MTTASNRKCCRCVSAAFASQACVTVKPSSSSDSAINSRSSGSSSTTSTVGTFGSVIAIKPPGVQDFEETGSWPISTLGDDGQGRFDMTDVLVVEDDSDVRELLVDPVAGARPHGRIRARRRRGDPRPPERARALLARGDRRRDARRRWTGGTASGKNGKPWRPGRGGEWVRVSSDSFGSPAARRGRLPVQAVHTPTDRNDRSSSAAFLSLRSCPVGVFGVAGPTRGRPSKHALLRFLQRNQRYFGRHRSCVNTPVPVWCQPSHRSVKPGTLAKVGQSAPAERRRNASSQGRSRESDTRPAGHRSRRCP